MKFNRAQLRAAVSKAIAADLAAQEESQAEQLAGYEKEVTQWHAAHANAWLDSLPKIRAKIRKGLPVTDDDLPGERRYGSRYSAVFGGHKPRVYAFTPHADLTTLANVLDLLTDEEVTDTALARVGVRSHMIRRMAELIRVER